MKVIGITGYIASGKSTIAKIFLEKGYNIFDADKIVHKIYNSAEALEFFQKFIPESIINKEVQRKIIANKITNEPQYLKKIEKFFHPRIRNYLNEFLTENKKNNAKIIILDIPLLFESGLDKICDYKIFCQATEENMLARFLKRGEDNKEKFFFLLKKQQEFNKENLSDFIIENNQDIINLERQINNLINKIINS